MALQIREFRVTGLCRGSPVGGVLRCRCVLLMTRRCGPPGPRTAAHRAGSGTAPAATAPSPPRRPWVADALPDALRRRIIGGGTVSSTMSRYQRSSHRGKVGLPIAVLSAVQLGASCTHGVTRRASHVWPGDEPITYNVLACGGDMMCSSGLTGSVPSALRRPLRLPALPRGRCPIHRATVVEPNTGAAEGPGRSARSSPAPPGGRAC